MAIAVDPKDPQEVLDYTIDWTDRLLTDTISDHAFAVAQGSVVIDSSSIASGNKKTVVWLSGGTLGETALVTGTIETAAGRTMEQTIKIKIKAK